jgi:hypothetical protein
LKFLQKADDVLRKAWVLFVGMRDLKGREHAIKNHPNFQEEIILNRPDIDNIFLHQQSVLIRLEIDVKIRP